MAAQTETGPVKLGVFGGTFNPIHKAHVHMAVACAQHLQLNRIVLIPTYIPPHKQVLDLAGAADRLAMCRLAVQDHPLFEVCDYEIRQEGKSFTYKTLEYLRGCYPGMEMLLLMGADMFLTVQSWRKAREIFRLATLCAVQREPGEAPGLEAHRVALEAMGAKCVVLDVEPTPLSSTEVRSAVRAGEDVSDMLSPSVRDYIHRHGLYR